MADLRAAALRYASQGVPVFLLTGSKRPAANCALCRGADLAEHDPERCDHLVCHGFYAATTDTDRIGAMFRVVLAPMLAIRTGAASGLVVVDVDPAHGGDESLAGLVSRGLTPRTALVRTGSGGTHLYYRAPNVAVPNSQSRLGAGVDVRADGGYVCAPPSVHPKTRLPYRWVHGLEMAEMPAALIEACAPAPEPMRTNLRTPASCSSAPAYSRPDRLLEKLLDTVRKAPEGMRRTTLYGSARGVARMVAAGVLSSSDAIAALTDAGRAAGQTNRETAAAIRGGFHAEGVSA